MSQSLEILTVFHTLTLQQFFWITKTPFSENWSTDFQLKVLSIKAHHFHTKMQFQKPMLRKIEWGVQNGPITENRVLRLTILFFKVCFSLRTL